jgi:hypothetical protein
MNTQSNSVLETVIARKRLMNEHLTKALRRTGYLAKRSYVAGLSLLFVSVGASALAGVLGLLKFPSETVGAIAFLSGFATLLGTTFKFLEKANWYYTRKDRLYELYNRFAYGGPPDNDENAPAALMYIETISNDWNKMNSVLAENWKSDLQINIEGAAKNSSGLVASVSKSPD